MKRTALPGAPATTRATSRRVSMIGLFVLVLSAPPAQADRVRNVEIGQPVPAFTVTTLSGDELRSASLRGKVVVLVYVAAEQQRSEKAALSAGAIEREFRNQDLAVLSLTADVVRVGFFREQRARLGIHHPLGLDVARRVYGEIGLIVLPTTLVIDREGRLAHVISSYKADHDHVLLAYVRHALGLIDDAELDEEMTSRRLPRDRDAERVARHRSAARMLRETGLLQDAEKSLRAALAIDPDHADALLDLASLCIALERIDEADDLVQRVMTANAGHRRGKLMLGIVLFRRGRLDDAERLLREVLLLNPDPVLTHYYLGLIEERRGDQSAAIAHFKEALTRLLRKHPM